MKGKVVIEKIESNLLRSNPPGDPYQRDLYLYLPPSYDLGDRRYPSVLCLSGFTGSARSWFNFQAWIPSIDERMDRLFAAGMPEMILIFPDCFTKYGGSQYLDSPATGAYRSHLVKEILPLVDQKYRTIPDRRSRGVMGKSSGGYGAVSMALDHPDLFSALACHSGDLYFEYAYWGDLPAAFRKLSQLGGLASFFEKFDQLSKTSKEDHPMLNIIAMSACYSPNPHNPPHFFDLPFDERTGEVRPEIWRKWKEKDPVEIAKQKGRNLKDFGVVYLDCGRRDEFYLDIGARLFCDVLLKQGVKFHYEEFDGGHSNIQHRYDVSLKRFAEYFSL